MMSSVYVQKQYPKKSTPKSAFPILISFKAYWNAMLDNVIAST